MVVVGIGERGHQVSDAGLKRRLGWFLGIFASPQNPHFIWYTATFITQCNILHKSTPGLSTLIKLS